MTVEWTLQKVARDETAGWLVLVAVRQETGVQVHQFHKTSGLKVAVNRGGIKSVGVKAGSYVGNSAQSNLLIHRHRV